MNLFVLYLEEGIRHILDPYGYDHILFVSVLCASYALKDWKPLLVLVTAFTIGHSVTLALATLNLIRIPTYWVELLIPITIIVTAVLNLIPKKRDGIPLKKDYLFKYGMALFFGLIHGLGFSNFLRSMLSKEDSLFWPLLAFNIGLEAGQLVVVVILILLSSILFLIRPQSDLYWKKGISIVSIGIALKLVLERI